MLKDATGFKKIYIAAGKTDLRKGMDSLAAIVSLQFELDPYETDILFLFCGSTRRLIKGLVWEGDGFVLVSVRQNAELLGMDGVGRRRLGGSTQKDCHEGKEKDSFVHKRIVWKVGVGAAF